MAPKVLPIVLLFTGAVQSSISNGDGHQLRMRNIEGTDKQTFKIVQLTDLHYGEDERKDIESSQQVNFLIQ